METTKLSTKKFAINNGLLLGLAGVVLGVIIYVLNMHLEQSWVSSVVGTIITIIILVYAFKQYKSANNGFMSIGQGLKLGMGIIVISTIISVIFNYVLMNIIEPDMLAQMQELQMEKMIETNPDMTQSQIDAAKEMSAKFSSPAIVAAVQLAIGLIFGFIITLITALIMKKNDPSA